MRRHLLAVLGTIALLPGLAVACTESPPPAPADDCSHRPVRPFDGKTLDGWSHAGPGGFDVVDGTLQTRDGMGLLWYPAREFADYELRLQWRVRSETDNSGIFVRFPDPGDDPLVGVDQGYEIQINDNPGGDPQKTGAIYGFQQPDTSGSRPVGSWNDYRVEVVGERYRVWLNDRLVNDFTSTDPTRGRSGYVGLQNHDPSARVQFRQITVRPRCP